MNKRSIILFAVKSDHVNGFDVACYLDHAEGFGEVYYPVYPEGVESPVYLRAKIFEGPVDAALDHAGKELRENEVVVNTIPYDL